MPHPSPSPADAVGPAWQRMTELLFRPVMPVRWLVLGLFSFLEVLGGGGGFPTEGVSFRRHWSGDVGSHELFSREQLHDFAAWVHEHQALLLAVAVPAMVMGLALAVLLHWLA